MLYNWILCFFFTNLITYNREIENSNSLPFNQGNNTIYAI
jgi:hypothetical protein